MKSKRITKLFFFVFLSFSIFIEGVKAEESINISSNSTIKYKWYIEEKVDERYSAKGYSSDEYYEDVDKVKYGESSPCSENYCRFSNVTYDVSKRVETIYYHVADTKYIKITNFTPNDSIRIFTNAKEIEYKVERSKTNEIIIDLLNSYRVETLLFYINMNQPGSMYLSSDETFDNSMSLYHHINENEIILIPDKTWIYEKTKYYKTPLKDNEKVNDFMTFEGFKTVCSVRNIYTYRYKINKKYYDDDYHEYVEGYIPDLNDYYIEYHGEFPTKLVNITNTIKEIVPIKEYIYVSPNNENKNNENNENNHKDIQISQDKIVETKYIENEVIKKVDVIPQKIYIVIIILALLSIIEFIILIKKKVERNK